MSASERLPQLDVAKGFAILGVIAIHSELFSPSLFDTHIVNRAVPMFLVMFGMTSTLWWNRTDETGRVRAWYRSRLLRLAPPYWTAVLVWWIAQTLLAKQPLGVDVLALSLTSYAPWIQTSWFVAVISQLILVFPLLVLVTKKLGAIPATVAALGILIAAQSQAVGLNVWLRDQLPYNEAAVGFYPFWLFIPHYFWLVLCGTQMTKWAVSPSARSLLIAFTVVVLAGIAEPLVTKPSALLRVAASIADPARTVLLLGASVMVARSELPRRALAWLGTNSWEIYVGQMAVHSLAYPAWQRAGGPFEHRIEYTLVLLIGGLAFATAMIAARRLKGHSTRRP
jgi:peptidoglycan/LPS O-acetylase OafA/YrhL